MYILLKLQNSLNSASSATACFSRCYLDPSGPRLLCNFGPLGQILSKHQGSAQPTALFVAEVQVRPTLLRRHAAGPQPAGGASGSCHWVFRPQVLPGRSRYLLFLDTAHPATPLFLSTWYFTKAKKMLKFNRLKGLSQVALFALLSSPSL